MPGQAGAAVQERGLIGFDREQVVGLLAGHQELSGGGAGVQRVGSDHRSGEVKVGQQRLEGGDLIRGAAELLLGEHGTGGMVHRGEQVHLPVVGCAAGAAEGLTVDRDRPSPPPSLFMVVAA
jgi:hypothetical protein